MDKQRLSTRKILIILITLTVDVNSLSDLGYSLGRFDESPGVYCDNNGIANL